MDTAANGCPWVANLASEAPVVPLAPPAGGRSRPARGA